MYVSNWTTAAVYCIAKHPRKTNLSDVSNGQVIAPLSNINFRVVFVTSQRNVKRYKRKTGSKIHLKNISKFVVQLFFSAIVLNQFARMNYHAVVA